MAKSLPCRSLKRIKAIFFLLCFLIAHSGISISTHWCGRVLTHISFFAHDTDPCECGKIKKEMKGCCKDKTATLKAKSDLSTATVTSFKVSGFASYPIFHHEGNTKTVLPVLYTVDFPEDPPPYRPKVPLYLQDGVFLI